MEKRHYVIGKPGKEILLILLVTVALLCIPLLAMQFTDKVRWTMLDFIVAGILLIGTGLLFKLIFRKIKSIRLRIAAGIVLVLICILIWAELAVGIFNSPLAGK